jgi:hypothetical protein
VEETREQRKAHKQLRGIARSLAKYFQEQASYKRRELREAPTNPRSGMGYVRK